MRQEHFEKNGAVRWRVFEEMLQALDAGDELRAEEFPALYRQICQDLALARDRQFTRDVHDRLNRLALEGHHRLYGVRRSGHQWILELATTGFPRALRAEARLFWFVTLVFYGIALLVTFAIKLDPDLAHAFVSPERLASIEEMYDPSGPRVGLPRDAGSDVYMFGFYIWNNISIAFRSFAAGLVVGIGTLAIVGFNGLFFGAVVGHLSNVGSGQPLYTFVIAHGAFELTAILISGVAGMRLGLSILAPGNKSRGQALRDSARTAIPLVYGAGAMLLVAAAVEAFWSPRVFPAAVKYGMGGVTWSLVILYLTFAGRHGTRADP